MGTESIARGHVMPTQCNLCMHAILAHRLLAGNFQKRIDLAFAPEDLPCKVAPAAPHSASCGKMLCATFAPSVYPRLNLTVNGQESTEDMPRTICWMRLGFNNRADPAFLPAQRAFGQRDPQHSNKFIKRVVWQGTVGSGFESTSFNPSKYVSRV